MVLKSCQNYLISPGYKEGFNNAENEDVYLWIIRAFDIYYTSKTYSNCYIYVQN